jgi:hypothetical protein
LRDFDRSACPHRNRQQALKRLFGLLVSGRRAFGSKSLMGLSNQCPNEDLSFGMQVPKEVQLELLERRVQIGRQNLVNLTCRLGLFVGYPFTTRI